MTPRLLSPKDAADAATAALARSWPNAVIAEVAKDEPYELQMGLHPGVRSRTRPHDVDWGQWQAWADSWREAVSALPVGCELVRGVPFDAGAPHRIRVSGLRAAAAIICAFGEARLDIDLERAEKVARDLVTRDAELTARTLRQVCALADHDLEVLLASLDWLREHQDQLGQLTDRQLPIVGMHTKWWGRYGALVGALAGRDVTRGVRRRVPVAHLTYVDPAYLRGGGRRHDAWTGGDTHDLAYEARVVLIVENRDCRLSFPPMDATVVVEGSGRAATWLLADVPWVRHAEHVLYWGDLDAEGFEILHHLRTRMAQPCPDGSPARAVVSMLMDSRALSHYAALGVGRGSSGEPLRRRATDLTSLTESERAAYYALTTAGEVAVRRVEQERIPVTDAVAQARALVGQGH